MDYAIIGMIIGCYGAIIIMQRWVAQRTHAGEQNVAAKMQEINTTLNRHIQDIEIHPNRHDLMPRDLCDERVKRIEGKIDTFSDRIGELIDEIRKNGHQ